MCDNVRMRPCTIIDPLIFQIPRQFELTAVQDPEDIKDEATVYNRTLT